GMKMTTNTFKAPAMNTRLNKTLLVTAIMAFGGLPVLAAAQPHAGHGGHAAQTSQVVMPESHSSGMDHPSTTGSDMDAHSMGRAGMDHGSVSTGNGHDEHGMNGVTGQMDHGDMKMQGGSAPADARDPDAYSGGYVRNAGKFALPPSHALNMSDTHNFGSVKFDRFEYVKARGNEWGAYEGEAWYGSTYNRAVIKAEGEVASGRLEESQTELLWRHAISAYWDTELGARFDYTSGAPNREW